MPAYVPSWIPSIEKQSIDFVLNCWSQAGGVNGETKFFDMLQETVIQRLSAPKRLEAEKEKLGPHAHLGVKFVLELTFDEDSEEGRCKLVSNGAELERWQVRKTALEGLFFPVRFLS